MTHNITPMLWFDTEAEEAAAFYCSLFPDSRITDVSRYGDVGPREAGMVLAVSFELEGRPFTALNGGPEFPFTEAVSFVVNCETQAEIDRFWDALAANGGEESMCGWLKDRFGLSWQIVPTALPRMLQDADPDQANAVMRAMLQMRRIEVPVLEAAYAAAKAEPVATA
jgi:predicted 3-demethylubiquinone-9 3-methyltransferase (glyoxalase superfamily)